MLRSREAREPPAGASREGDGNRGLGQWSVLLGRGPRAHSAFGAGVARSLLACRNVRGVLRLSRRTRAASPPHVRLSLCVGTGGVAPARSG